MIQVKGQVVVEFVPSGPLVVTGGDLGGKQDITFRSRFPNGATAFPTVSITAPFTNGYVPYFESANYVYTNAAPLFDVPVGQDRTWYLSKEAAWSTGGAGAIVRCAAGAIAQTRLFDKSSIGGGVTVLQATGAGALLTVDLFDNATIGTNTLAQAAGGTLSVARDGSATSVVQAQAGMPSGTVVTSATSLALTYPPSGSDAVTNPVPIVVTVDSVVGSDTTGDGTAAKPWKTWRRFALALGWVSALFLSSATITVTVPNDLPTTDPILLDTFVQNGVDLVINGTQTISGPAGTFTAFTAMTRATNTPQQQTDAANPGNFAAGNVGLQLQDTTTNSIGWIEKNIAAGQCRCSLPMTANPATGIVTPSSNVAAAGGDAYRVNTITQATLGRVAAKAASVNFTAPNIQFNNLRFRQSPNFAPTINVEGAVKFNFVQCRFDVGLQVTGFSTGPLSNIGVNFVNCFFTAACTISGNVIARFNGGVSQLRHLGQGAAQVWFDADHVFSDTASSSSSASAATGCVIYYGKVWSFGFFMFVLFEGGSINIQQVQAAYGTANLTGTPATGVAQLAPGCIVRFAAATVWNISNALTFSFPTSTGTSVNTFNPATGLWSVGGVSTTITNLLAAVPAGFGNHMFDPMSGAGVIQQ